MGIGVERSRLGFWVRVFSLGGDAVLEGSVGLAYWFFSGNYGVENSQHARVREICSLCNFDCCIHRAWGLLCLKQQFPEIGARSRPLKLIVLRVPPQKGPQGCGNFSSFKP